MTKTVKIAKEFHWEMAHRLPYHTGGCQNIHGHSYILWVEIEGQPQENGMLLDYAEIKRIVKPMIDTLDHGFICSSNDTAVLAFLNNSKFKMTIVDFYTTAENLCYYFADAIEKEIIKYPHVHSMKIRICETRSSYAEITRSLKR